MPLKSTNHINLQLTISIFNNNNNNNDNNNNTTFYLVANVLRINELIKFNHFKHYLKEIYLMYRLDFNRHYQSRSEWTWMKTKRYLTLSQIPEQDPHHQMQFCVIHWACFILKGQINHLQELSNLWESIMTHIPHPQHDHCLFISISICSFVSKIRLVQGHERIELHETQSTRLVNDLSSGWWGIPQSSCTFSFPMSDLKLLILMFLIHLKEKWEC